MVNRKTASAITIAVLMASVPAQLRSFPAAAKAVDLAVATDVVKVAAIAQVAPSFSVPDSVPKDTQIRISSSSDNMNTISSLLQKGFEGTYAGSKVAIQTKSVDAALQDVLNDNADLAAISRPLTDAEKAKGLIAVPVRREKIAIVVGKANPFNKSLTGSQFAQIFRGEIKDWSKVGGAAGPIRVIDRAATSETRQSLQPYPVFKTAPFKTSDNATQLPEESTEALVKALGKDGISYALVGEVEGQGDLKAIALHQTLPTDPRYPFSQPYSFVYIGGASQSVQAFLGYATGTPGQAALNGANLTGDGVIAAAANNSAGTAGSAAVGADTATGNAPSNPPENGAGNSTDEVSGNVADGNVPAVASDPGASDATNSLTDKGRWWWLLLPLAGLGLLLWAAGKRSTEEETDYLTNTDGTSTAGLAAVGSDESDESDEIHSNLNPGTEYDSVNSDAASSELMPSLSNDSYEEPLSTGLPDIPPSIPFDQSSHIGDGGAAAIGGAALSSASAATPDLWAQPTDADDGAMELDLSSDLDSDLEDSLQSAASPDDGVRTSMQEDVVGIRSSLIDNPDQTDNPHPIDSVSETTATTATTHDPDSWLERAKRRINEATEQIKETTADIKTDIKEDSTRD
ncbi:MAG: hypothetical protein DCF15_13795 [Phormidesmis priestleyi]|uniref:PBP domain-containing protein n=1 Tax=Phormidesmis priestleyi TaxID=268141 RepID=A0A2W4Z078_9CYAN|nr:MAG: hypothetical protein DCF15_13795 [Phormidesmis priestleyi]